MKLQKISSTVLVVAMLLIFQAPISSAITFSDSLAVGKSTASLNRYIPSGTKSEILRFYFKSFENTRVNEITFKIDDPENTIEYLILHDENGNITSPGYFYEDNGVARVSLEIGIGERTVQEYKLTAKTKSSAVGKIKASILKSTDITATSAVDNNSLQIIGVNSSTFPINGPYISVQPTELKVNFNSANPDATYIRANSSNVEILRLDFKGTPENIQVNYLEFQRKGIFPNEVLKKVKVVDSVTGEIYGASTNFTNNILKLTLSHPLRISAFDPKSISILVDVSDSSFSGANFSLGLMRAKGVGLTSGTTVSGETLPLWSNYYSLLD